MIKQFRLALLASAVIGLGSTLTSQPALAYFEHHHTDHIATTHHKHKHHVARHKKRHGHGPSTAMIRDAQGSLINLDYLHDKADGKMGPKTIKAIKAFQKDHSLPVDGKLTRQTYNAIIKADKNRAMASLPVPTFKAATPPPVNKDALAQPPGVVGVTDQQYADPLLGGKTAVDDKGNLLPERTRELSSRYAKLSLTENKTGDQHTYDLTVNGTSVLQVDKQPSIIGVSETYTLDHEDALILTTYHDGDKVCAYKHYLLVLAKGENQLHAIGDCTHGYQARKVEDSLFITFPEFDDAREAGATWRYEDGDLEKL